MELKIVNHTAPSFNEAVGVSEERSNDLSKQMDLLIKSYGHSAVRTCDTFNEIAQMCNSVEELVFCVITHTNYMAVKLGQVLCPPKDGVRSKEEIVEAMNTILQNRELSYAYKEDTVDILKWVLRGEKFDGL